MTDESFNLHVPAADYSDERSTLQTTEVYIPGLTMEYACLDHAFIAGAGHYRQPMRRYRVRLAFAKDTLVAHDGFCWR